MTVGAAFNEGHTDASGNLRTDTFFHKRCQANRRAMALLPASAMARLSHEGLGSTVVQGRA